MKKSLCLILYITIAAALTSITSCNNKTQKQTTTVETKDNTKATATEKQITDTVTLSGKMLTASSANSYCFFVDPEMVAQKITEGLGDKAETGICTHPKYGKGVPVVFSELNKNSDYPNLPSSDVLIVVKGYWKQEAYNGKEKVQVFYVYEYQPFF